MTETVNLGLPLVEAAQAQKHVTVNEAFARIDALADLTLGSIGASNPPFAPSDGEVHAVGSNASGDWFGFDGQLALFLNGGWDFVAPRPGWRAWSAGDGHVVTFDGVDWVPGLVAVGPMGGAFAEQTVEMDHAIGTGASSSVAAALPAGALVVGVSARVLSAIGGVSSVKLGVAGDTDRFAAGLGASAGSTSTEIRTAGVAYPSGADLILTANGGTFNGTGSVRLAIHMITLRAPRA